VDRVEPPADDCGPCGGVVHSIALCR
jgi:hypothetical protein